jgi:hypothetical protein
MPQIAGREQWTTLFLKLLFNALLFFLLTIQRPFKKDKEESALCRAGFSVIVQWLPGLGASREARK